MALGDQSLNFRITADGGQAVGQLRRFGQEVGGLKQQIDRVNASASGLAAELRPLQNLLGAIGVSFGVAQVVQVADAYGQMTARLRLATQYSGDFAEVQQRLKVAANETRSPIGDLVGLYTSLSPALQGMGRNAAESVNIISTVSKAVALSGGSAESAQAALFQLSQGFASGTLRGDELNSVMEQTPGLARAIADGLGVSVGQLRTMGEQGRLTGEEVTRALEKVAARVDSDFRKLPITIGQAFTILQNQIVEVVGTADQGSGALASMARAIVFVADGIGSFANAGETIRPVVEFVVDAVDGVARLFRIVATGLAGYTLVIKQALSGDLRAALATYREIGAEVDRILLEPVAAQKRVVAEAASTATARAKIETDLNTEIARLEQLRAVAAGRANADILLDDKGLQQKRIEEARKATEEQLKGAERLRDALRTAWEGAVEGARKAKEEAVKLLQQAADAQQSGVDKAADRRMQGMTPEERDAAARREARNLADEASSSAARATIKAFEGDLKGAEKLAADAAKQAERAEKFAGMIADDETAARLFEELGNIRAEALRAEAKIKDAEAAAQTEQATAIQGQIKSAEDRLVALKAELAKPVQIQLDITAAEAKINALVRRLSELSVKDGGAGMQQGDLRKIENALGGGASPAQPGAPEATKNVEVTAQTSSAETALEQVKTAVDAIPAEKTVNIRTVSESGAVGFSDAASAWNSKQNGFAAGGWTGPGSKYQPAGIVHADEFVTRREVVRQPGALGFLDLFNRVGMRAFELFRNGYAAGGLVQQASRLSTVGAGFLSSLNSLSLPGFADGGLASAAIQPALADSGGGNTPLVLDMGQLGRFETSARQDVADELVRVFQRAALQRGRRS